VRRRDHAAPGMTLKYVHARLRLVRCPDQARIQRGVTGVETPQKSLKRDPECIKMHHFEGENAKIFLGRGHSPLLRPHPHWGLPRPHPCRRLRRLHSSAHSNPPDHISGYGPGPDCGLSLSASIVCNIGVGDGGREQMPPQKKKFGKKYFSGKNHVKFGRFVNFFGHISCNLIRAFC